MKLMPLWIVILFIGGSTCVKYKDLKKLGVACKPRDTCITFRRKFENKNCACDRSCLLYGDCCVNGPKPTRRRPETRLTDIECVPNLPFKGVYAISTCSSSWDGPSDIREKCENEDDLSDLSMSTIATDTQSKKTYKSLYCAKCNDVNPTQLSSWSLSVSCSSLAKIHSQYSNITEQYIMDNIVYVGKSWGIYHYDDSRGGSSFFPCEVGFLMPQSAERHVRLCRPNLVSACASDWNREAELQACDSYMAAIYINGQGYRNAHCALCNNVPLDNHNCNPDGSEIKRRWFNFNVNVLLHRLNFHGLLAFRPKEKQHACAPEQLYDTVFKKCRRLICHVGYEARNHECVKN